MEFISVIKNGISFPVKQYPELERPFTFRTLNGFSIEVGEKDIPVYFARKRMRMVGGKCVDAYIHKYCVGVIREDGTQDTHWVHFNGIYGGKNEEQVKIKE